MNFTTALRTTLRKTLLSTVALGTVALGFGLSQGSASAATPAVSAAPMSAAAAWQAPRLTKMVVEANHQTTLGIPYVYGGGHGASPAPLRSHVDCSGFIREMYGYAFGVDIGNGSGDSIVRLSGRFTKTTHPVPGDVVLVGSGPGSGVAEHAYIFTHMVNGVPVGVGAPQTGDNIRVQDPTTRYWRTWIMGYWHFKGATAADSGPLTQPKVAGHFDATSGTPGGFNLSGWSVDPQKKAAGAGISVIVDNRLVAHLPTNVLRADVNKSQAATGKHGFATAIPFAAGRHTVCLTATSAATSSAANNLGCKAVTVPGPTRGSFDKAAGAKRTFTVSGWAFDPATSSVSSAIRVTVDGKAVADTHASGVRADVNRVYKIAGNHAFTVRLGATAGRHNICVAALPASSASFQVSLGCKVVTVTA